MKIFTLLAFLFLLPPCAWAQMTNEGFEEWKIEGEQEMPAGWAGSPFGVGRENVPYSGNGAVSVWNWYHYGLGYVVLGERASMDFDLKYAGVPIDFIPTKLTGYYKYELGQNLFAGEKIDSAAVYVMVKRYNPELRDIDTIAFAVGLLPPSSDWIPFSVDLPLKMQGVQPDSMVVAFYSSNPENGAVCGPDSGFCCYLSVDDVALNTTSGVRYDLDFLLSPARVLPNPVVNAYAVVRFSGRAGERYRLAVTDLSGRLVLEREVAAPEANLTELELPSGAYQLTISDETNRPVAAGRFVVEYTGR